MPRGDDPVATGLHGLSGGFHRGNHVKPYQSRRLDHFGPGHGIPRRGDHDLQPFFHFRVFFPDLDCGLDHPLRAFQNLRRDQGVEPEDSLGLFGLLQRVPENVLQRLGRCFAFHTGFERLLELFVSFTAESFGFQRAGTDEAEGSRVRNGNA